MSLTHPNCAECNARTGARNLRADRRLLDARAEAYGRARAAERTANTYRNIVFFLAAFVVGAVLLYAAFVSVGGEFDRREGVMDYHRAEIAAVEAVMGE